MPLDFVIDEGESGSGGYVGGGSGGAAGNGKSYSTESPSSKDVYGSSNSNCNNSDEVSPSWSWERSAIRLPRSLGNKRVSGNWQLSDCLLDWSPMQNLHARLTVELTDWMIDWVIDGRLIGSERPVPTRNWLPWDDFFSTSAYLGLLCPCRCRNKRPWC